MAEFDNTGAVKGHAGSYLGKYSPTTVQAYKAGGSHKCDIVWECFTLCLYPRLKEDL